MSIAFWGAFATMNVEQLSLYTHMAKQQKKRKKSPAQKLAAPVQAARQEAPKNIFAGGGAGGKASFSPGTKRVPSAGRKR